MFCFDLNDLDLRKRKSEQRTRAFSLSVSPRQSQKKKTTKNDETKNSCVVLHLAATQALQHAAGNPPHFAQWHFGLVVALLSLGLAQARNLAHMSKLLAAGTAAQLFAVSVVMTTLITKPDRKAPATKLFENHGWVRTSVAVLNVFFAYGGKRFF